MKGSHNLSIISFLQYYVMVLMTVYIKMMAAGTCNSQLFILMRADG
jgi:hypothetical protein